MEYEITLLLPFSEFITPINGYSLIKWDRANVAIIIAMPNPYLWTVDPCKPFYHRILGGKDAKALFIPGQSQTLMQPIKLATPWNNITCLLSLYSV